MCGAIFGACACVIVSATLHIVLSSVTSMRMPEPQRTEQDTWVRLLRVSQFWASQKANPQTHKDVNQIVCPIPELKSIERHWDSQPVATAHTICEAWIWRPRGHWNLSTCGAWHPNRQMFHHFLQHTAVALQTRLQKLCWFLPSLGLSTWRSG